MSPEIFPRQTLEQTDDKFPPWGMMEAKQNYKIFFEWTDALELKDVSRSGNFINPILLFFYIRPNNSTPLINEIRLFENSI